jgi:hypothetical protein
MCASWTFLQSLQACLSFARSHLIFLASPVREVCPEVSLGRCVQSCHRFPTVGSPMQASLRVLADCRASDAAGRSAQPRLAAAGRSPRIASRLDALRGSPRSSASRSPRLASHLAGQPRARAFVPLALQRSGLPRHRLAIGSTLRRTSMRAC